MKLEGLNKLVEQLKGMAAKRTGASDGQPSVIVGFAAAYAVFVHENMETWPPGMRLAGKQRPKPHRGRYWDPQGKAGPKFLEGPARELSNSGELGRIIAQGMLSGKTLAQSLLTAGLKLQREAQLRVPVETGNLKASAFTKLEQRT